jgi:hypothetical protein
MFEADDDGPFGVIRFSKVIVKENYGSIFRNGRMCIKLLNSATVLKDNSRIQTKKC